jgi:hypothetical protein
MGPAEDEQNGVRQDASAADRKEKRREMMTVTRRRVKKVGSFVAGQWLILGFSLSCLLAHFFPCKCRSVSESVSRTRG